jgi:hypothetical protein
MENAATDNWQEGIDLTTLLRQTLGLTDDDVHPAGGTPSRFGHWWQVGVMALIALFIILVVWQ